MAEKRYVHTYGPLFGKWLRDQLGIRERPRSGRMEKGTLRTEIDPERLEFSLDMAVMKITGLALEMTSHRPDCYNVETITNEHPERNNLLYFTVSFWYPI
jgi:hypothetical protein